MTDERQGWPSASGFWHLCPGSHAAQKGLPDLEREDAKHGTEVHAYIAACLRGDVDNLWGDEVREDGGEIIAKVEKAKEAAGFGGVDPLMIEQRLWIQFGQNKSSGQPDVVFTSDNSALVLDHKSGWGDHNPAHINNQLRRLAVLVSANCGVLDVHVGLIPRHSEVTLSHYSTDDLALASEEYRNELADALSPNAPRIPGSHCKLCRAAGQCAEAAAYAQGLQVELSIKPAASKAEIINTVIHLSNEQLAAVAPKIKTVEAIADAVRSEIKRRLKHGEQIDGCELKPGRETKEITDPFALWDTMEEQSMDDLFWAATKVSVPALKKAHKSRNGGLSKSESDAWVDATIAPFIKTTTSDQILELP